MSGDRFVWLNGSLLASRRAKISLLDRGFMYGDGLFETLRAYKGRPFLLEAHLHRVLCSAHALGIAARLEAAKLGPALGRLITANGLGRGDCALRIILTRGPAAPALLPPAGCAPTLAALAIPLERGLGRLQRQGIAAVFFQGATAGRMLAGHKTLDYLPAILARRYARTRGAREAIFVGHGRHVLEGATSNVFAVQDGDLITPAARGILPGITRAVVIELAARLGLRVRQRALARDELLEASEIFITASTVEILPVTRLEGRRLRIGKVTRSLQKSYRQYVRETLHL